VTRLRLLARLALVLAATCTVLAAIAPANAQAINDVGGSADGTGIYGGGGFTATLTVAVTGTPDAATCRL
jgi:hypothetical protein